MCTGCSLCASPVGNPYPDQVANFSNRILTRSTDTAGKSQLPLACSARAATYRCRQAITCAPGIKPKGAVPMIVCTPL